MVVLVRGPESLDLIVHHANLLRHHAAKLVLLSLQLLLALVDDLLGDLGIGLHAAHLLDWPLDHRLLVLELRKSDVLGVLGHLLRLLVELLDGLVCQVGRVVVRGVADHALLGLLHGLVLLLEVLLLDEHLRHLALAYVLALLQAVLLHFQVLLQLLILLLLEVGILVVEGALLAEGRLGGLRLGSALDLGLGWDVGAWMEHHGLGRVHDLRGGTHSLYLPCAGVKGLHLLVRVVLAHVHWLLTLDCLDLLLEIVVHHRVRLLHALRPPDVFQLHLQLHQGLLLHLVHVELRVGLLALVDELLAVEVFVVRH